MKRSSCLVLSVLAGLVAAAPAAAQSPSPQQLTGGQALPAAEQGFVQALTGKAGATTVPKGWTILAWNTPVTAGTPLALSVQCPAGTLVADFEPGDPAAPITAEYTPSDFIPFYGRNALQLSATTAPGQSSGTVSLTVVCLPSVRLRSTRVTGRSPVAFPKTQTAQGLRKGARIPRSWRLYKSVTTGPISADGAVGATGHLCPAGTQIFSNPVFQPRRRGMVLVSNGFVLAPGQSKGPVTAYTLCSTFTP
jgi:hypothetical protein